MSIKKGSNKKKIIIIIITIIIIVLLLLLRSCSKKQEVIDNTSINEILVQETVQEQVKTEEPVSEQETTVEEIAVEAEEKVVDKTTLSYWVNFLNKDGSVLQRTTYKYGETPSYNGNTPTYEDGSYYYSFNGWDKAFSVVTGTQIYTALYDITGTVVRSNPTPTVVPNYLTFTANTAGAQFALNWFGSENEDVALQIKSSSTSVFCDDDPVNAEWTDYAIGGVITLTNISDSIQFKAKTTNASFSISDSYYFYFYMSGEIAASGDITSLLNGVGGDVALTDYCFYNLFKDCSSLVAAPTLPSTTLATSCYESMFDGCTSLESLPASNEDGYYLPAEALATDCYKNMFYNVGFSIADYIPAEYLSYGKLIKKNDDITSEVLETIFGSTAATGAKEEVYWYVLGGECFAAGTKVTMSNGSQKNIEDVTNGDTILAWDFINGEYVTANIATITNHGSKNYNITTLNFDDNASIDIIGRHCFFDYTLKKFVNISDDNVNDFIGHEFVLNNDGSNEYVELVSYDASNIKTNAYSIISANYLNVVCNNLLSLDPMINFLNPFTINSDLKYDEDEYLDDITNIGLYTYEEFKQIAPYITETQFNAGCGQYIKIALAKGIVTIEEIKMYARNVLTDQQYIID